MGMLPRGFGLLMLLAACTSPPPPERISKARWVECWTLCGKKDNLVSVTNAHCICKGGVKIEKDTGNGERDEEKAENVPFELFDWLTK